MRNPFFTLDLIAGYIVGIPLGLIVFALVHAPVTTAWIGGGILALLTIGHVIRTEIRLRRDPGYDD